MTDKYNNKYRVPSARLSHWDYGSNASYYITICTQNSVHYFGDIALMQDADKQYLASLDKSILGEIAYNNWLDIPNHFPFIELDEFIVMPNHIHGILFINKPDKVDWQVNKFGKQSQNLASVMRGYKASVKTFATTNAIEFGWQPRYYDHVILNEKDYLNIKEYITNNPQQWLLNGDNEDNLYKP